MSLSVFNLSLRNDSPNETGLDYSTEEKKQRNSYSSKNSIQYNTKILTRPGTMR